MKKGWLALVGFLLFAFGLFALIMNLVGMELAFLVWTNNISPTFGFLFKIAMMITGVIVMWFNLTNWDEELEEEVISG
ncbi:MAG: hypothetical protein AAF502_13735 [Bacteroidota bacterium]